MGVCAVCGSDAGLLRSECKSCAERRVSAITARRQAELAHKEELSLAAQTAENDLSSFILNGPDGRLATTVNELAQSLAGFGGDREVTEIVCGRALDAAILSGEFDEACAGRIDKLLKKLKFENSISDEWLKYSILREIADGNLTPIDADAPFVLQPGEVILWAESDVTFNKYRSKTAYGDKRHTVSLRVTRDIRYSFGLGSGEARQEEYLSEEGIGELFISNAGVYFSSDAKSVRIFHSKILSVEATDIGVVLAETRSNSRPSVFEVADPAFVSQMIHILVAQNQ